LPSTNWPTSNALDQDTPAETASTWPALTLGWQQPLTLADPKPGWVVSVTARRERGNQVAEVVKVVLER